MSAGTMRRTMIGPWRVVDFLGAGGMGEVYRAVHASSGRVAAVKVLTSAARTPAMIQRFRNEGRIQSALHHPHIVRLYDVFEHEGSPCIAMEYVAGECLEEVLRRGPVTVPQALTWFAQVADAVACVHERGVVHRDLKTNNIKIDEAGRVKLLDFGIAKGSDSPRLTTDGSVIGTLHYLSPEQVRGESATTASDVWALGVVLYEMVTGRVPFASASLTGVMTRILKGSYDPPVREGVVIDGEVTRLIARCLRVNAAQRPAAVELRRVSPARPDGALPRPVVFADAEQLMKVAARRAGDLRRRWTRVSPVVSEHAPLAAAVTATVAAVAFLALTLFDSGPGPRVPELPGRDTALVVLESGNATALRPVMINVFGEAPAQVFRDGRLLGETPVRFQAPLGAWVTVSIRRDGFEPLERRFQVHDGANDYTESLRELPPLPGR